MTWLQGDKLLSFKEHDLETRNRLATAMFKAWWLPFSRFGVIHGDPHLGNYSVFSEGGEAQGINLLDYGCVRIFPPRFVGGVVDLYQGLLHDDQERVVHAYETWGFKNLRKDLVEVLNVWARFIYGPLLDDRVRTIANGVAPGAYGRQEAFTVHKALKEKGPVTIPREFVFMDRAAIGLGGVFLHLNAELNFFKLFNEAIAEASPLKSWKGDEGNAPSESYRQKRRRMASVKRGAPRKTYTFACDYGADATSIRQNHDILI